MEGFYKIGMVGLGSIGNRHLKNIVSYLTERGNTYKIDLIRSGEGKKLDIEISKHIN